MGGLEAYLPWIVQAVAGLIGGGVLGTVLKGKGLGTVGNLVIGALGGLAAGYGLNASGHAGTLTALVGNNALLGDAVAGFVGGGLLQAVTGMVFGAKKAAAN